jgi:hypothetical protein
MRGTRIEKEEDICDTNLTNKTEKMSNNAMKWKTICEDIISEDGKRSSFRNVVFSSS